VSKITLKSCVTVPLVKKSKCRSCTVHKYQWIESRAIKKRVIDRLEVIFGRQAVTPPPKETNFQVTHDSVNIMQNIEFRTKKKGFLMEKKRKKKKFRQKIVHVAERWE
jgi:hypothetical protein